MPESIRERGTADVSLSILPQPGIAKKRDRTSGSQADLEVLKKGGERERIWLGPGCCQIPLEIEGAWWLPSPSKEVLGREGVLQWWPKPQNRSIRGAVHCYIRDSGASTSPVLETRLSLPYRKEQLFSSQHAVLSSL